MNRFYTPVNQSKLLYFVTFLVLCFVDVNANFVDSQRFNYKYDTFDLFKISDNNLQMLEPKKNEQHNFTYEDESSNNLSFNKMLINFIDKSLNLTYYELAPGIFVLKNNDTIESSNHGRKADDKLNVLHRLIKFAENHVISVPLSLPESTGRLFFFKGNLI